MIIGLSWSPHDTWVGCFLTARQSAGARRVTSIGCAKYVMYTQLTIPKTGLWAATPFYNRVRWKQD